MKCYIRTLLQLILRSQITWFIKSSTITLPGLFLPSLKYQVLYPTLIKILCKKDHYCLYCKDESINLLEITRFPHGTSETQTLTFGSQILGYWTLCSLLPPYLFSELYLKLKWSFLSIMYLLL